MLFSTIFSFKPIIQYIDEQFERFLHDESGLNRRNIVDNRVHCCFYFINPAGHGYVLIIAGNRLGLSLIGIFYRLAYR